MSSKNRYIPALDGLRAFAVLAVIAYHMNFSWAQGGLLGVTVFFVLSGYLITGLLITEWATTKTIDLKNFWMRRVKRLVPAIIFVVVTVAALCAIFNHELLTKMRPDIPSALLFFSNWWYIFHDLSYFEALGAPSPLNHFWSLAIEEQFYLVWPVMLFAVFKLGAKRPLLRRITLVLAALSALVMAFLYNPTADPSRIYYGTDTRAFSLFIGAWLAFVWPAGRFRRQNGKRLTQQQCSILDGIGIAALIGLLAMIVFTDGFSPFLYCGGLVLASVLTAIVIAAVVYPGSRFAHSISAKPLIWIGKRSYGMYLWHYPILLLMNPRNFTGEINPLYYVLEIALIFAVSAFSFKFIEDPVRKGEIGRIVAGIRDHSIDVPRAVSKRIVPLFGASAIALIAIGGIIFVPPTSAVGNVEAIKEATVDRTIPIDTSFMPIIGTKHIAEITYFQKPEPTKMRYNILMIGDSVSVRTEPYFNEAFPKGLLDGAVSRQFGTGQEIYSYYKDEDLVGRTVVFALGTNGVATDEQIDDLVAAVGEDKLIYLVNTRSPQPWVEETNAALATAPDRHKNVHLIDWFSLSADHDDYFDGDGTHLNELGAQAYIDMIKAATGK